ncbi:hypothetical protein [Roseibium sediminis]|uniref:hypothetical protein n=1 Tax=Roseibium sediminis TaxID=1775174 RepID=UPI00123DB023|nr:hypothetical protein [Roseibium sediminis]
MTIDAMKEGRAQVLGDGVTSRVDLDFQFVDEKNLSVIHTDANGVNIEWAYQQAPGNWTYTGGDFKAGSVHFDASALKPGERLTVVLVSDYDQHYKLTGGEIDPKVIENALDDTAVSMQALAARVGRTIVFPATLPGQLPNFELPSLQEGQGLIMKGGQLVGAPLDTSQFPGWLQTAEENAERSEEAANAAAQSEAALWAAIHAIQNSNHFYDDGRITDEVTEFEDMGRLF